MKESRSFTRPAQSRRSRGRTPGLRADLAHRYAASRGRDPSTPQLDWLERIMRWIGSCPPQEEREIRRTLEQIVIALGLPYDGTVKGARNRYKRQIYNTLGYLHAMGMVEAREALWEPNGEGRCIVISLPAGVAQSVRAGQYGGGARRSPVASQSVSSGDAPRRRRSSFSPTFTPPSRERPLQDVNRAPGNGGASARVPIGTPVERFAAHAIVRLQRQKAIAALELLGWPDRLESGGPELWSHPALLEAPPQVVARLLFQRALPQVGPRWTAKRQAQLEAAARRIDRCSGRRGEWIRVAAMVLEAWADGDTCFGWCSGPPRSLGALAIELRREANLRRHRLQERCQPAPAGLDGARVRVARKRWVREVRELARATPHINVAGGLSKPWRDGPRG